MAQTQLYQSVDQSDVVFTGSDVAWLMTLDEVRQDEGMREFLPELLIMFGSDWVGSLDPDILASALGVPSETVRPIAERLKRSGLWSVVGPAYGLERLPDDKLGHTTHLVLGCLVARGELLAHFDRVKLGIQGIDGREIRPLMRRHDRGAFSTQELRAFLRESHGPRFKQRRALVATLVKRQLLIRVEGDRRWCFSPKVEREWIFSKTKDQVPMTCWQVGLCSPLRPSSVFANFLIHSCGIAAADLAEIWCTDLETVEAWLKAPPPPLSTHEEVASAHSGVAIGNGLKSKDKRRSQTGTILALRNDGVSVRWKDGTETFVRNNRLKRYALIGPVKVEDFPSRAIEMPKVGMKVQSSDKRRNEDGEVIQVTQTSILVKWSRGIVTEIQNHRLVRYSFSDTLKKTPSVTSQAPTKNLS